MLFPRLITGLAFITTLWAVYCFLPPICFSVLLFTILSFILAFEWPLLISTRSRQYQFLTPFYPCLPFGCMIFLNQSELYHHLIPYLFIIVCSFDTGSYIAGKLVGRHKIAPRISPGKTWEGFLGGYVITLCVLGLIKWYGCIQTLNPLLILVICILALLGDLFESWLKRRAQLKDSGSLLPGHGGLLDRFDGVMFVAVFFYVAKDWLITIF